MLGLLSREWDGQGVHGHFPTKVHLVVGPVEGGQAAGLSHRMEPAWSSRSLGIISTARTRWERSRSGGDRDGHARIRCANSPEGRAGASQGCGAVGVVVRGVPASLPGLPCWRGAASAAGSGRPESGPVASRRLLPSGWHAAPGASASWPPTRALRLTEDTPAALHDRLASATRPGHRVGPSPGRGMVLLRSLRRQHDPLIRQKSHIVWGGAAPSPVHEPARQPGRGDPSSLPECSTLVVEPARRMHTGWAITAAAPPISPRHSDSRARA